MMKTTTFSKLANNNNNSNTNNPTSSSRIPSSKSSNCFTYGSPHHQAPTTPNPAPTSTPTTTNWRRSDSNLFTLTSFKHTASHSPSHLTHINLNDFVNEAIGVDYLGSGSASGNDSYYYYYQNPSQGSNATQLVIGESGDSDELIFSDHAGLFESLNKPAPNTTGSTALVNHESMLQESINKNLFRMAKQHYKLTNVSNENLCEYESDDEDDDENDEEFSENEHEDDEPNADSINNWSMRLSGGMCKQRRLIKLLNKSSSSGNNSTSSAATRSGSMLLTSSTKSPSSQTTSWNKLKQSSSNLNEVKPTRQPKPARRTVTEPCVVSEEAEKRLSLIKLYQTRQQCQRQSFDTKESLINALNIYNNFSSSDISHTDTASTPTSTLAPPESKTKIRKSPTITFGELKSRSSSQLTPAIQTIGTQYPPRLTDQCIQTSYPCPGEANEPHLVLTINEEKLTLKRAFYKSLPDLSFLNEYSSVNYSQLLTKEEIAKFEATLIDGDPMMSADLKLLINSSSNHSSLSASTQLAQQAQEKRKTLKSIKRYRQTKQNTEPCALPELASQMLRPTNSFSAKATKIIVMPTNLSPPPTPKRVNATQHPSTNSSSSSSSSGYQSAACTNQATTGAGSVMPLKSCLKNRYDRVTVAEVQRRNSSIHVLARSASTKTKANSQSIHIPSIGWLFTCDSKSLKKYSYYKKIAGEAKKSSDSEGDDDDVDEEIEEEIEEEDVDEAEVECDEVIEEEEDDAEAEMRNKKSVSFCEKISHHTITPPTSHSSPSHVTPAKSEPLHYDALIKMLRGSSVIVEGGGVVSGAEKRLMLMQHHRCHAAIAIEADAISLASLNESPPNEFKFSDDDAEDVGHALGLVRIGNANNGAGEVEVHGNLKENQRELNEKLNQFLLNNSNLRHINANFSTNPFIVELKAIVSELRHMSKTQQILDNEKCSSLDKILREGLCKVLFELLKENLKLFSYQSSKQTSRNDEMRYEKLCSLFESLLARLSSNANNNSFGQSVGKKINETFILNEVNSIQKFEAFIYFFLNCKQLATIFESLHNDKILLHKYYENLASRVTFLTISDNCKQLTTLKFNLKYYFNAKHTVTSKAEPSPAPPMSPTGSSTLPTAKTSRPQPINQAPVVSRQSTIRKNSLRLPVSTPPSTSPVSNLIPPQKPQCVATIHVSKQKQLIPTGSIANKSITSQASSNASNPINNNNGVGFHLKNLSKKLNIKSWFHSNSQNSPQTSVKSVATTKKVGAPLSPFSYADPMKISISEPMINEMASNSSNQIAKIKK